MPARSLSRLQRRLDVLALDQLRAEAARLAIENDELRRENDYLGHCADTWREDVMRLQESLPATHALGMTQDGAPHVVPAGAQS